MTNQVPHPLSYNRLDQDPLHQHLIKELEVGYLQLLETKHASIFQVADRVIKRVAERANAFRLSKSTCEDILERLIGFAFKKKAGAIIESTLALDELMMQTDIDQAPCSMLKPPYPATYFMLKEGPNILQAHGDIALGMYVLHRRVQIDKNDASDINFIKNTSDINVEQADIVDHYEMSLVLLSAVTKKQVCAIRMTFSIDSNSQVGVVDTVKKLITDSQIRARGSEYEDVLSKAITCVFKSMMYMGLKDARVQVNNEHTDFNKRLTGLGPKKLAKLSGKANLKYDRIIIGPEKLQQDRGSHHGDGSEHKTTHWRRGHFRNQRHGEGFKDSKLVWIQPLIVNQADDQKPEPKKYKVRM